MAPRSKLAPNAGKVAPKSCKTEGTLGMMLRGDAGAGSLTAELGSSRVRRPGMSLPKRTDIASRGLGGGEAATHAALVIVQLAFAAGAVEGKLALGPASGGGAGIDPIALAAARMVGGALVFQALARGGRSLQPVARADHARIAGLALLG